MTALLIYDIHCPKTYRLIYKKLDKFVNSRIQKSVFEVVGTATELQQMFDELNTPEVIFIDRGYIVNIIQIMKISDGMAVLKNGEQLPISRSHLQEVKRQINQLWGAHI